MFDESIVPGPKSVIGSLSADSIICLHHLYSKLYLAYGNQFQEDKCLYHLPYSSITWRGKSLTSTLNQNARNPFVFVAPPFSFASGIRTEFTGEERLAEIDFFLMHSVVLPESLEPKSHLLACAKWPIVHHNRFYFGKPVEVWCNNIYEPQAINRFFLASTITARAIISIGKSLQ